MISYDDAAVAVFVNGFFVVEDSSLRTPLLLVLVLVYITSTSSTSSTSPLGSKHTGRTWDISFDFGLV